MSAIRLFNPDLGQASGPEPGTLAFSAAKYRAHLTSRVAAADYSAARLKITMGYVESFLAFVFSEDKAAPVLLGRLPIAEAKQAHLIAWLVDNYPRWKKGSTRADALGAVLGCFNWVEEALAEASPFRRPRNLKFPRTHHRALRTEHYRAVMREARKDPGSKEFRTIFFAAYRAGVRLIEFRQLEPHEIDWERGVGRIPAEKHKTGRSTGEDRPFGINPWLLAVLRSLWQAMKPGQKYLFLAPGGRPWSKDRLGRHYGRYRRLAGVSPAIKLCAVRHGYAVRAIQKGETSKAVADQLGHKGTAMVEAIYGAETRYDGNFLREVATRVERGKKMAQPVKKKRVEPAEPSPLFDGLG